MARFIFKLPDIGEGISEAEIVAWHVAVGDRLEEDQQIADVMTDKATVEMESPVAGMVVELAGAVGDQIAIGSTLIVIETDRVSSAPGLPEAAEALREPSAAAESASAEIARPLSSARPTADTPGIAMTVDTVPPQPQLIPSRATLDARSGKGVLTSPAVRHRAMELGIDLAEVKADGDRVRHADLDAFLRYGTAQGFRAPHNGHALEDETIKLVGLRRRIAENMAASKRHIPHFTYVEEIEVTKLEELRAALNASRGAKSKLTLLPLLIVAFCKALPGFPMINARYDDEAGVVTRHGAVHLGMATQTDGGLMVPVIRDAQDRNIWQLATEIQRLAQAARSGKARSEELSGSTLTVTSLGPLGGIATTPVINRPEVAILGPNRVIERPIFRDGKVAAAKLMNLSISCDHRVVDGWDAASYIQAVRALLETPGLLFAD